MKLWHTRSYPSSTSHRLLAIHIGSLLLLLAGLAMNTPAIATPNVIDTKTIQYLLEYVRESNLTFVRNFSDHTSADAASHIQKKYRHFQDKIKTPEEFIELCASKSLMTGRTYRVIDEQGHELQTRDWLMHALTAYRNEQSQTSAK